MGTTLFKKSAVVVTFQSQDKITDGFAVIEGPKIIKSFGGHWIEGVHSQESSKFVRGRRVLIPLAAVTSITEYDSASEAYASRPRKKGK